MRVLWHSVAPWVPTGYGTQTAQATVRLKEQGHDVAISTYYGLQGAMSVWQGMNVYPCYAAPYGTDVIVPHALHHFGADQAANLRQASAMGLIITLGDVWTLDAPVLPEMAVAAWCPVDHDPISPPTRNWFAWSSAVPIAMSRFGQHQFETHDIPCVYVPHGIDTQLFTPGDRAEARERAGLPADAFVVAIVAANVGRDGNRKAFAEQIAAFAELRRKHPDSMLVLHTDVDAPVGTRLRPLLEQLPEGSFAYSDQYQLRKGMPADMVADIYRAADVLSNTSWGEGFGLPIVEAQACGTPVVVTDATAMPELCGAGWRVPWQGVWHDQQRSWAAAPRIDGIIDAYLDAYDQASGLREQARTFALGYDADLVAAEHWQPVMDRLAGALAQRAEAAARPPRRSTVRERVVESDGLLWVDRGQSSDDGIGWGPHEAELEPIIRSLLPDGGTFLDVGAHVGRWSLRLADTAAHVVAVEANPSTARTLRRHIAMNDLGERVQVVEMAAWDARQVLRLDDPHGHIDGGSTRVLPLTSGQAAELDAHQGEVIDEQTIGVPLTRAMPLDQALGLGALAGPLAPSDYGDRIDLVKLDVEGADLHALRGMRQLLDRYQPTLFIERHDIYGYYTLEELTDLLARLGYVHRTAGQYLASVYLVCTPTPDSPQEEPS